MAACIHGALRVRLGFRTPVDRRARRQPASSFFFAVTHDGLAAGPEGFGWQAKFEEVTLICESLTELPGERYVEVLAGSKSATILMNRETG